MSSCISDAFKAEKWFCFFFVSHMKGSIFELFSSSLSSLLCSALELESDIRRNHA